MSTKHLSLADGETLLVISDLHLGDGTGSDDFSYADFRKLKDAEKSLLSWIEEVNPTHLVLAGDIEELWQHTKQPIYRIYKQFYESLQDRPYTRLIGNHDYENVGIDKLIVRRTDGSTVFIAHGHQPDPFMTNPFTRLGIWVLGWLEKVFPSIDSMFEKIKDPVDGNQVTTTYAINQLKKYNFVVLGHTHVHGEPSPRYYNSGTCQHGRREGVLIANHYIVPIRRS